MAARGECVDGSCGRILIEHDVIAHDGILKGAADKTNLGNGWCFTLV